MARVGGAGRGGAACGLRNRQGFQSLTRHLRRGRRTPRRLLSEPTWPRCATLPGAPGNPPPLGGPLPPCHPSTHMALPPCPGAHRYPGAPGSLSPNSQGLPMPAAAICALSAACGPDTPPLADSGISACRCRPSACGRGISTSRRATVGGPCTSAWWTARRSGSCLRTSMWTASWWTGQLTTTSPWRSGTAWYLGPPWPAFRRPTTTATGRACSLHPSLADHPCRLLVPRRGAGCPLGGPAPCATTGLSSTGPSSSLRTAAPCSACHSRHALSDRRTSLGVRRWGQGQWRCSRTTGPSTRACSGGPPRGRQEGMTRRTTEWEMRSGGLP